MKEISTVIFDLGRVLVNIDFDAFPRALGIDRKHADKTVEAAVERMAVQYETGKIGTDQFLESLEKIFLGKFSREQLLAAWNAIIEEENAAMLPIVDAVQARYQTAILSNTSPTHFIKAYDTTAIIKKFSKRYLSFQIGSMKPDPVVYNYVIRDLSAAPSSILFIDDISENITAAMKCGIQGLLYTDIPHLKADFLLKQIL